MSNRVTVDWSAAEMMLPILPYVASRQVPPDDLVDRLVASQGVQVWLRHANLHGGLTETRYREIIKRAATSAEESTGSFLADWLRRQAMRGDEIPRLSAAFRALSFEAMCDDAYARANEQLPHEFSGKVSIYLMCASRGSAIVLDNSIAIDIADYPDPQIAPLNLGLLGELLAHEIFHMGREQAARALREALPDRPGIQLAGMLMEEGAATYLFSQAFMAHQVGKAWNESKANVPDILGRFSEVLATAIDASSDDQAILGKCYSFFGIEGYALGCAMSEAIDTALGRPALHQSLRDPAAFLETFGNAVDAANLPIPKFPADTVGKLKAICSAASDSLRGTKKTMSRR